MNRVPPRRELTVGMTSVKSLCAVPVYTLGTVFLGILRTVDMFQKTRTGL